MHHGIIKNFFNSAVLVLHPIAFICGVLLNWWNPWMSEKLSVETFLCIIWRWRKSWLDPSTSSRTIFAREFLVRILLVSGKVIVCCFWWISTPPLLFLFLLSELNSNGFIDGALGIGGSWETRYCCDMLDSAGISLCHARCWFHSCGSFLCFFDFLVLAYSCVFLFNFTQHTHLKTSICLNTNLFLVHLTELATPISTIDSKRLTLDINSLIGTRIFFVIMASDTGNQAHGVWSEIKLPLRPAP